MTITVSKRWFSGILRGLGTSYDRSKPKSRLLEQRWNMASKGTKTAIKQIIPESSIALGRAIVL